MTKKKAFEDTMGFIKRCLDDEDYWVEINRSDYEKIMGYVAELESKISDSEREKLPNFHD